MKWPMYLCLAAKHVSTPSLFPCWIKVMAEKRMEPRKWQENDWQHYQQHTHLHFYLCEGKHLEAINAASTTLIDCHTNLNTGHKNTAGHRKTSVYKKGLI